MTLQARKKIAFLQLALHPCPAGAWPVRVPAQLSEAPFSGACVGFRAQLAPEAFAGAVRVSHPAGTSSRRRTTVLVGLVHDLIRYLERI
jgi:hypothetical protein